MTILATLLLALAAAAPQAPSTPSAFHPDEILQPPGGGEVAVFRHVPPEVIAIRVSVPFEEVREEAGAGQLLRIQAQDRMAVLAARVGARAAVHRTPQALVYEVSGAAADLDFLAWILREGMRRPTSAEFEPARRQLRVELDRRMETPQGVLHERIREGLAPGTAPVSGSHGSLDRMDSSRLEAIWARTHRRESLRIVIAARAPSALVLSALSGLGLGPDVPVPDIPPPQDAGSPRPSPEVIRHWTSEAYPIAGRAEAAPLVAARWIAEVLRADGGDFEAAVEIWDLGAQRALVLSGAAYPRSRQAMEARVRGAIDDASRRLTEEDVRRIAGGLRAEILRLGSTPWGRAELVGQSWDSGHGPGGVEELITSLEGLSYQEVYDTLRTLAATTPLREELRP